MAKQILFPKILSSENLSLLAEILNKIFLFKMQKCVVPSAVLLLIPSSANGAGQAWGAFYISVRVRSKES